MTEISQTTVTEVQSYEVSPGTRYARTVNVGDVVTTYWSGFYRLQGITIKEIPPDRRWHTAVRTEVTATVIRISDKDGKATLRPRPRICPATALQVVTTEIAQRMYDQEIGRATSKYQILMQSIPPPRLQVYSDIGITEVDSLVLAQPS